MATTIIAIIAVISVVYAALKLKKKAEKNVYKKNVNNGHVWYYSKRGNTDRV